jgi:Family of unknown function (DUF5309)
MAVIANTVLTFAAIGAREDLRDALYNIDPTETPFMEMAGTKKAKQYLHEWQIESNDTPGANAQLEGEDTQTGFTFGGGAQPVRAGNRTQILIKSLIVSGSAEATDFAGRNSEKARLMKLRAASLRNDTEVALVQNQAPITRAAGIAGQLRPLEGWYATNAQRGVGGANGTTSAAATDGTTRAYTEALLAAGIQAAWTSGGRPSVAMMSPGKKRATSGFTGNGTRFHETDKAKVLNTAIDIYMSDFGDIRMVPNRRVRDRTVHVLTPDLWDIAYLKDRNQKLLGLSKTGDNEKDMYVSELTLVSMQEAGNAVIADLQ